ncbi:MAG: DEAD/DEAH box helicase [Myxococcaceae bacterium]|nr:DEAD/DEAH box helicase [Myxococcaceae bacterium]
MSDIENILPLTQGGTAERPAEYIADIGFDDLPMAPELRRAVDERGWKHPTPVQARAFQPVVEGRDLIVRSKTGTGKTGAFGLPILQKLQPGERNARALVLCPTRELALQVAGELRELAKYRDLKVAAIYGGASMRDQEDALEEGSAIVVGTPGRVYDHIRRKNLKLEHCTHVVLDEADEMLNQGFYEEVTRILDHLPKDRQVLLFSATVPEDIQRLIARYTTDAETILMSGDVYTVEHIHHIRYDISDAYPKPRNLIYVLEMHDPDHAIIFCNTRDDTELVTAVLNRNGFDAELLNGDLPQKERERVMGKVKRGEVAFMVATDLAARGIDISGLRYVINYSLPEDPAVYLHRVGRTGRIGNKGTAINLTSGRELATLTALERKYGVQFELRQMPSPEEAARMWTERHVKEIKEAASSSVYEGYFQLANELRGRPDAEDLIAFLLKYFFQHHRMEKSGGNEAASTEATAPREDRSRRERGERGSRRERAERERTEREPRQREGGEQKRKQTPALEAGPGQVKLWIGLGRSNDLDDAGLRAALGSLGAPQEKLIAVDVRPTFSYALVAEEDAPAFEGLNGKPFRDRTLKIERARPRDERPARERGARAEADEPGTTRLWVGLGSAEGHDEAGVQATLEAAGAPKDAVRQVVVRPQFSFVVVKDEHVAGFEALNGKEVDGAPLKVERARPKGEKPPRPARPPDPPEVVRLWCSLAEKEGFDPEKVAATLEAAGAPAGRIHRVSMRPGYSYVLVKDESDVEAFLALTGKQAGDKTLKLERARSKR